MEGDGSVCLGCGRGSARGSKGRLKFGAWRGGRRRASRPVVRFRKRRLRYETRKTKFVAL